MTGARQGVIVSLLVSLAGAPANAQTVTATAGAVNGIVTDSSSAGIPGVTVTLSGPALITTRTSTTEESGAYHFSAVPTGDYALTFELAGFSTILHDGISVGLGFTATLNVMMSPGTISDLVTVSGAAPVVDVSSTGVTTRFDAGRLAALPGSRDFYAVLGNTPGVAMTRMDVGGNLALNLQDYTAYGLRATTGVNRTEVEGIRVGGATGRQRQLLFRLWLVCRDCDQGRRQHRRDAGARHPRPVRQQVRRQYVSRRRLRGLPG